MDVLRPFRTAGAGWMMAMVMIGVAARAPALETAGQILERRRMLEQTARHWSDRHQRMRVTITDRDGDARQRDVDVYERRSGDGEQKAIVFLRAPANMQGVRLLSLVHRDGPSELWLYQPEYKKVRRIAAEMEKMSFVGSDLAYRDLALLTEMPMWSETDAHATRRGEEAIDGTPCDVIDLVPNGDHAGYQHVVVWLGREDLVARQIELYEHAPSAVTPGLDAGTGGAPPTKRIRQQDIRMEGTVPIPRRVIIQTPAAGSETVIDITDVQLNQGLPDDFFSQRRLERGSN